MKIRPAVRTALLVVLTMTCSFATGTMALRADSAIKESPAPKIPADEQEYLDKLDFALTPLLSMNPSPADLQALSLAATAARTGNQERFAETKAQISDPVGRKLADWIRLRAGNGEPDEYQIFLKNNPEWPDRSTLTQRFEEALFTHGGDPQTIKGYFDHALPETGAGYAALASADLAAGDKEGARKLASKAWREMTIPAAQEAEFLKHLGSLLTPADHKWRFDMMVTDDVRYAGNRTDRVAAARRIIPLLSQADQKTASARLAVFNKASNANALMGALTASHSADPGLAFHRAQLLRKAGKIEDAANIILAIPPDPKKIAMLDEWWAERRELAYGALKLGRTDLAYALCKDAGPLSVNPRKEQTFLAGWIALRYLKNTDAAKKHFEAMQDAADGPLSKAKAAYWLGRVDDSRGRKTEAAAHYKDAAQYSDTFHGLLAMQMLEPGRTTLKIKPPAFPSPDQIDKIVGMDCAKALILARKANLSREITRTLLAGLRNALPTEAGAGMVAHLAEALGDPQMSLRIAKVSVGKGQNLLTFAYPLKPFPGYKPLRTPPELPFLLGLARQETEFESQTVSGAGARGLLQVMPVTARHVCRDYKIKCDIPRLLSDTQYNATVASAYVADRMEEFGGSYVLGLAGYNAGPGRARQWVRENGDPRDPKVDPIDWIERIPIMETREYVTKVLANIQMYRARLGDTGNALRVKQDLVRARGTYKMPGSDSGGSGGSDTEG